MKFSQWIAKVLLYIIVSVNAHYDDDHDDIFEDEKTYVTVGTNKLLFPL